MNRPLILTDSTGLQSGKKPNKDDEIIKVKTTEPKITKVDVTYLDKTIYNDVPVGGEFEIKYTYIVNSDLTSKNPEEAAKNAASIEPAPARDIKGNIVEDIKPKGTLADTENLEKTKPDVVTVTPNGKDEGFEVTKTERFRVNDVKERKSAEFNGTINYQIVLRDPTGEVRRVVTTDRKYYDKAISISNAPRKNKREEEE